MYTRKPLGTIIYAVALITSAIELAYILYIVYDLIVSLSSKVPLDSNHIIAKIVLIYLFLAILMRIFSIIVSFLHLFAPNIIMSMYKSESRFILFAFHTFFSLGVSMTAIWAIIVFDELDHEAVLFTTGAVFLVAANVSMWSGVDNALFPWKTSSAKPGELTGQGMERGAAEAALIGGFCSIFSCLS